MADEESTSKPTATALWRRWRPDNLVPRLAPRLNRRRRRSSTSFPLHAGDEQEQKQEQDSSPEHPTSPRSTSPPPFEGQEEITTPRSDVQEALTPDTDTSFSLTPPASSPSPLIVSAKRLGSEVRRNHSKRRKGRLGNDKENVAFNVTSWRAENEVEDEVEEGLPPCHHLPQEERAKRYWQWCYGTDEPMPQTHTSWSASRAPPSKSCLSSRKQPMIRAVTIETPTLDRLSSKNSLESSAYATPSATPPQQFETETAANAKPSSSKSVQFGMPSAVEYEIDCPPKELTPMPSDICRERFPVVPKSPEREEFTEQTKHNTATLAEWEADFDAYLSSDDDEESEELETMLFSRKRGRRNSGFFSPSPTLLLPQDQQVDCEEDDAEVNTSMASLAVRSPGCSSPRDHKTMSEDYPSTPSTGSMMHVSPPSDAVHLNSVNSMGGALVEPLVSHTELSPDLDASRQLHGALERCADHAAENEIDILQKLMGNPSSSDTDWPAEPILRTMAKLPQQQLTDIPFEHAILSLHGSFESLGKTIQKHILKDIAKIPKVPCLPPPEECPLEIFNTISMAVNLEWRQLELNNLVSLLEEMKTTNAFAMNEGIALDERMRMVQRPRGWNKVAYLENLVSSERSERDWLKTQVRYQEATLELERAAPFELIRCLALNGMSPISLDVLPSGGIDVSFPNSVDGPQPCIRREMDGSFGAYIKPEAKASDGNNSIPTNNRVNVAASLFQSLLFTNDGAELHPSILQRIRSNDLTESVFALSYVIGRLDLAIHDLLHVLQKPHVQGATVERHGNFLVKLQISFPNFQVHFWYDRTCPRSLAYSIPSRVSVMQAGVAIASLEQVAKRTLKEAWMTCGLTRICHACSLSL